MGYFDGLAHLSRVALQATRGDAEQVMTLHYAFYEELLDVEATTTALASRLADDLIAPLRSLFDSSWTVQPVTITDEVDPLFPDHPREQVSAGTGGAGTRGDPPNKLPLALSAVARLHTAKIGRSFRGRFWIPGSKTEGDIDDGEWATVSDMRLGAIDLMESIPLEPDIVTGTSAPVKLVVYSATRRKRSQTPYFMPVTAIDCDWRIHWLRSRDDGF